MSDHEDAEWAEREEREYRAAQEAAREIVTAIKMAEEQGEGDTFARGMVRETMRDFTPRQSWQLVEVLAWAVADTFDGGLEEWSAHILKALAEEDDK